jgi:hypothetical protein
MSTNMRFQKSRGFVMRSRVSCLENARQQAVGDTAGGGKESRWIGVRCRRAKQQITFELAAVSSPICVYNWRRAPAQKGNRSRFRASNPLAPHVREGDSACQIECAVTFTNALSAAPSPPREERAGERRHFYMFGVPRAAYTRPHIEDAPLPNPLPTPSSWKEGTAWRRSF